MHTATDPVYRDLDTAYQFFNERLFDGALPPVALTLQRKAHSLGYHHPNKFSTKDNELADEVALNPDHFLGRTPEEVLSTLVHEMCHVWQKFTGRPAKGGYHDKQWAEKMEAIGLMPSDTGQPGGKTTGVKMNHYIIPRGKFAQCASELGFLDVTLWGSVPDPDPAKKPRESKAKFTCPSCGQNAWAKPTAHLVCGDCSEVGGAWNEMEIQS
jgi:hypothetical protein